MRIWHLTKMLKGGAGQYALRLSDALCEAGLDSTVLVADGQTDNRKGVQALTSVDTPLRRYWARAVRGLSHRIAHSAFHTLRGPEHYAAPAPMDAGDIVHLHGLTGWIGVSGLRRLIPDRTRVFQTIHGPWGLSGGCVIEAGMSCEKFKGTCDNCPVLRTPWKTLARAELQTKRSCISEFKIQPIANSQWMSTLVHNSSLYCDLPTPLVIPPLIDKAFLASQNQTLHQDLLLPKDQYVISLGALAITDPLKGIPEFLQHLSMSVELAKRTTVLLFGEGSLSIPENLDVRIMGPVRDPEILAQIYRTSNVFVSPSAMESFGMTLLEAQATGTPAICFDVGGVRDAIWPNHFNHLAPLGRWDILLNIISKILHNNNFGNTDKQDMLDWVKKHFAPADIAQKQILCYQQLGR